LSDDSFGILSKVLGGSPTTSVRTTRPEVGLVVDAPPALAGSIARALHGHGGAGSIGLSGSVQASTLATIRTNGSDPLPRLKPGGPVRWLGTRGQVKNLAEDLGVQGHIYYEPPSKGFTYSQSLLAKTAGASPLRGRVRIAGMGALGNVHRGDIVALSLDGKGDWRARLASVCRQLRARHLHAVPADVLLRHKA
jgi:hypothetical protein